MDQADFYTTRTLDEDNVEEIGRWCIGSTIASEFIDSFTPDEKIRLALNVPVEDGRVVRAQIDDKIALKKDGSYIVIDKNGEIK